MDWSDIIPYLPDLARGFLKSIEIALLSAATALVTALLLTLAAATGNAIVRAIVATYTEIILGLPILVLLYEIYFVLPKFGVRFDDIYAEELSHALAAGWLEHRGGVWHVKPGQFSRMHAIRSLFYTEPARRWLMALT